MGALADEWGTVGGSCAPCNHVCVSTVLYLSMLSRFLVHTVRTVSRM